MSSPALHKWAEKARKQNRARPSLHSIVFGAGGLRYFAYRTRLQLANLLVRMSLHIGEYFLIFHTVPSFLVAAMVIRAGSITIDSGWWGMMDSMRNRIRALGEKNDLNAIRLEIEQWFAASLRLALLVLLIGGVMIALFGHSLSHDALMLAMALQLASRLMVRTLYSGVYALRRVYIRFDWIIALDMAVFAAAWALNPWLGEWTLPLCLFLSALLSGAMSYYFVRKSMDFMRIAPSGLNVRLNAAALFAQHGAAKLLPPALSMIAIRLHDLVLLVVLVFSVSSAAQPQAMLYAVYMMLPVLRLAMNWSQIMFFDLNRSHLDSFRGLRRYFEVIGLAFGGVYGLLLAALVALVVAVFVPEVSGAIPLLVGYAVLSAQLGFVQISLFARGAHLRLIALALAQYAVLGVIGVAYAQLELALLVGALLPLVAGVLLLAITHARAQENELSVLAWNRYVLAQRAPLAVCVVILSENLPQGFAARIAQLIAAQFGERVHFCLSRGRYLLALPKGEPQLGLDRLTQESSGCIRTIMQHTAADGQAAWGWLYGVEAEGAKDLSALKAAFLRLYPGGLMQLPTRYEPAVQAAITSEEQRAIVQAALSQVEGRRAQQSGWHVASAQRGGLIEAIFLMPKRENTGAKALEWSGLLNAYNAKA